MRYFLVILAFIVAAQSVFASAIQQAPVPKSQFYSDEKVIIKQELKNNPQLLQEMVENIEESDLKGEFTKADIVALYNANNLEGAYQVIAKIPENERDSDMWLILANITQDYGKEDDAIKLLQKAIEVNPKNYKAYYNLGNIYFNQNKIYSARDNYILAVKYNREFPYSYYNLGCCYMKDSLYSQAKSNFLKAIKLKNDDPNFYYNLAFAYNKLNNKKQTDKILEIYNAFEI